MQIKGEKSGDLCKFWFGRAGLVRVSSLGRWHKESVQISQGCRGLALLVLLTLRPDLWLIPFLSFHALVSSCHLIALSD